MVAHGPIPVSTAVNYTPRFGRDSENAKTVAEYSGSTTAPGSESSTQQVGCKQQNIPSQLRESKSRFLDDAFQFSRKNQSISL